MKARDRGFALLIVLWTLVLVSLIATQVTASGRGAVQVATNLRRAAELEAAADGAVHEAMFRLLDRTATGWRADGRLRGLVMPQGDVTVLLEDQAGKINPNLASPELLAALLRQLGADTQSARSIAAAMADWRFPGAAPRPFGAKAREYRQAGRTYGPPEAPFETLGELGSVLGMTPVLLDRMVPHLSLFHNGDTEPALAGPVVMQALRAAFGTQEFVASPQTGPRVVAVTATVNGTERRRFIRRAIVRIEQGGASVPYRILAWASGEA